MNRWTNKANVALLHEASEGLTSPSSSDISRRGAKGGEAIEDSNADLEFGGLPVEVAGGKPQIEELHAVHLGLDTTASVVAAPPPPDRSADVSDGAQGLVSPWDTGTVFHPWLGVAPGRDDCVGAAGGDGVAADATVIGAVRGHQGDRLALGDLRRQAGQHRRVADAAPDDLDGPDLERRLVHGQMDLAPHASPRPAVLARMPLAFTAGLDARAVDEQVQRPTRAPVGELHGQRLLTSAERREAQHRPVETRKLQKARNETRRLFGVVGRTKP